METSERRRSYSKRKQKGTNSRGEYIYINLHTCDSRRLLRFWKGVWGAYSIYIAMNIIYISKRERKRARERERECIIHREKYQIYQNTEQKQQVHLAILMHLSRSLNVLSLDRYLWTGLNSYLIYIVSWKLFRYKSG